MIIAGLAPCHRKVGRPDNQGAEFEKSWVAFEVLNLVLDYPDAKVADYRSLCYPMDQSAYTWKQLSGNCILQEDPSCFCISALVILFLGFIGCLVIPVVLLWFQTSFIERKMRPGGIRIFRTQSPRHFEGGDWNQGGSCPRLKPLLPEEVGVCSSYLLSSIGL